MRRFAPLVLLVLVVAACGSDDASLSAGDARKIATRAQLTVADLGSGWKKTADEKPDDSDGSDQQLEQCVGSDLAMAEDTLAESNTRTFERSTSDVDQQQVVVSSAVLASKENAEDLFRIVATKKFADCITKTFEDELKGSGGDGVSYESAPATITTDEVTEADHSAQITAPFKLTIDPLSLDGQVDLVMVTTGQAFSLLFGFSLGEPIGQDQLGRVTDLLVQRQKP